MNRLTRTLILCLIPLGLLACADDTLTTPDKKTNPSPPAGQVEQ